MITLIAGPNGSGKTKKLIDFANNISQKSEGNVIVIEKGSQLTFDLTHKLRLINTEIYGVKRYDMFFGMLCGICAGNYDVSDIFIDSIFNICGDSEEIFVDFIKRLNSLSKITYTNFYITVSLLNVPQDIKKIIKEA